MGDAMQLGMKFAENHVDQFQVEIGKIVEEHGPNAQKDDEKPEAPEKKKPTAKP